MYMYCCEVLYLDANHHVSYNLCYNIYLTWGLSVCIFQFCCIGFFISHQFWVWYIGQNYFYNGTRLKQDILIHLYDHYVNAFVLQTLMQSIKGYTAITMDFCLSICLTVFVWYVCPYTKTCVKAFSYNFQLTIFKRTDFAPYYMKLSMYDFYHPTK